MLLKMNILVKMLTLSGRGYPSLWILGGWEGRGFQNSMLKIYKGPTILDKDWIGHSNGIHVQDCGPKTEQEFEI